MIPTNDLLAFRVKSLWRFFRSQGFAYGATCCYLFIEYVRPQGLIRPLSFVPIAEIALGTALLAHVGSGRWFAIKGPGSWLVLLFTAVIVLSSVTAYLPDVAMEQWQAWFSWVVVYFLIISVVDTEQRLVFFSFLWLLLHYYMSQGAAKQFAFRGFTFEQYGVAGTGWFINSGEFGVAMCMFLPVAWNYYLAARPYLSRWRKAFVLGMPITAVIGIVGSSSRGALLGLGAVAFWSLLRGKHRMRNAIAVAVMAIGVWQMLPPEQKDRINAMGEDYDATSQSRMTYWRNGLDMARNHPVLGVGYGNWVAYYGAHYYDARALRSQMSSRLQVSHNVFIQAMAELGYSGLAAFLLLIVVTLRSNRQARALARAGPGPPNSYLIEMAYGLDGAMIGYLTSGFFVTVLYYPFFWINLALTVALGSIARRDFRKRTAMGSLPAPQAVAARSGGLPRPRSLTT